MTSSRGQAVAAGDADADGEALDEALGEAEAPPDAEALAEALGVSLEDELGLLEGVEDDVTQAVEASGEAEAVPDADGVGEDDWPSDGVTRKAATSAATRAEVAKRAATFTRPDAECARG